MVVVQRVVAAAALKVAVEGVQGLVFLAEIGRARKPAYRLVAIVEMRRPVTRVAE